MHGIAHGLGILDLDLDLYLEGLLFHRAAERNQFGEDGLFALHEEGIDSERAREAASRSSSFSCEREQLMIAHEPLSIDHHVAHVGGLGRIHNLRIDVVRRTTEGG